MNLADLAVAAVGVLVVGALVIWPLCRYRRLAGWAATLLVGVAAAISLRAAIPVLTGKAVTSQLPVALPGLDASLSLTLDPLSALFLAVIAVLSFFAALYSVDYMAGYRDENLSRYYPPFLLFVAGMTGVVLVSDWFFFLICWEFMTLASWVLVIFEKENPVSLRAGIKYFLITHLATACMFLAALLLWQRGGSFNFIAGREALRGLADSSPALLHLVLALWFIGFGTKAGMLPFGDWLPDAHPAAPSPVSALLSGVMIKLGIYGMLRIFLGTLGPVETLAWGLVIALFGAGSAFVGSLTAMQQQDCKRLLAFSSIGQMGYLLMALGMGMVFLRVAPLFAVLALVALLYHLLNDAVFKALLFMNAGSVVHATGTRDLNQVGGLVAVMPVVAVTAMVGAFSLAGIPPLSGFASKWLIYQAALLGGMKYPALIVLGLLALFASVAGLAYALKFVGVAFFGKPGKLLEKKERSGAMVTAQLALAAGCVALGLIPGAVVRLLHGIVAPLLPSAVGAGPLGGSLVNVDAIFSSGAAPAAAWSPLTVLAALAVGLLIAHGISRLAAAPRREVAVWRCGELVPETQTRFRAQGLYGPFNSAFARLYPKMAVPRPRVPLLLQRAFDLDGWLYDPMVRRGNRVIERFSRTHTGIPQLYMLWQIIGAALVLGLLFWLLR